METFTEPKKMVENPSFLAQRKKSLGGLSVSMLDAPIRELINEFNQLPYGYTLQCCYGHFLYNGQTDPHNLSPLPKTNNTSDTIYSISRVEYRIAYIAFGLENNENGRRFFEALKAITAINPENIQLCSADWFWKQQVNSYALQVEPDRFKHEDKAFLDYNEALNIEKIRNDFFIGLRQLVQRYT